MPVVTPDAHPAGGASPLANRGAPNAAGSGAADEGAQLAGDAYVTVDDRGPHASSAGALPDRDAPYMAGAGAPFALPFDDSRRLTGANLFFASTGAVLEVHPGVLDDALVDEWRQRVARARDRLGWPNMATVARSHRPRAAAAPADPVQAIAAGASPAVPAGASLAVPAGASLAVPAGASLAIGAPCDQLFVATEVNEWALCSALLARDPIRWSDLEPALVRAALEDADEPDTVVHPVLEESAAFARLTQLAAAERRPALRELVQAASEHDLQRVLDDDILTLGAGTGGVDFPLGTLPAISDVPWRELHDIPTVLVTGSNGKTTTVRLLAACARAQGWHVAYSSTDGVFFDGEAICAGDYSGPAGGRLAVRDRRAQAAILETARGGILRRGIAVAQAHVAVVTNVSSDHFGEYGIFDLEGLADVKLSVAATVVSDGLLVLNADDTLLRSKVGGLAGRYGRCPPLGWFALDADSPQLRDHRAAGGATCGVREGRLYAFHAVPRADAPVGATAAAPTAAADTGATAVAATAAADIGATADAVQRGRFAIEHDLGPINAMPLTVDGSATYNIANLAGAALAALAMGVAPAAVASVFATFGARPEDNLGRLMRFDIGGVQVVLDYAHNVEGLRGVLRVAQHLRAGPGGAVGGPAGVGAPVGRLALLLGHAGNRQDADIEAVAKVAAEFKPDWVVVKENEGHLRGRQPGEVPRLIKAALLRAGLPESAVPIRMTEVEAARCAMEWARPGDVVALLVHSAAARAQVLEMLHVLRNAPRAS